MTKFDYGVPAELFTVRIPRGARAVRYHRFETGAEALRFAIETLPREQLLGAVLKVDGERYRHGEMRKLYDAGEYPLPRLEKEGEQAPNGKTALADKQASKSMSKPVSKAASKAASKATSKRKTSKASAHI